MFSHRDEGCEIPRVTVRRFRCSGSGHSFSPWPGSSRLPTTAKKALEKIFPVRVSHVIAHRLPCRRTTGAKVRGLRATREIRLSIVVQKTWVAGPIPAKEDRGVEIGASERSYGTGQLR